MKDTQDFDVLAMHAEGKNVSWPTDFTSGRHAGASEACVVKPGPGGHADKPDHARPARIDGQVLDGLLQQLAIAALSIGSELASAGR